MWEITVPVSRDESSVDCSFIMRVEVILTREGRGRRGVSMAALGNEVS